MDGALEGEYGALQPRGSHMAEHGNASHRNGQDEERLSLRHMALALSIMLAIVVTSFLWRLEDKDTPLELPEASELGDQESATPPPAVSREVPADGGEQDAPELEERSQDDSGERITERLRAALALQSRREALGFLGGMSTAQAAYKAMYGEYADPGPCPQATPGLERLDWAGPCAQAWEELGWRPGDRDQSGNPATTRCVYSMVLDVDTGLPPSKWGFEAIATCDGDGDGEQARYRATFQEEASMITEETVY
jgi:hypothetical protein